MPVRVLLKRLMLSARKGLGVRVIGCGLHHHAGKVFGGSSNNVWFGLGVSFFSGSAPSPQQTHNSTK